MFRSEPLKRSGAGKAKVPGSRRPQLIGDENGLRPSDAHEGVAAFGDHGAVRSGMRSIQPKKSLDDTAPMRPHKKQIEEKHEDNSELAKRIKGTAGVRKYQYVHADSCRTWGLDTEDLPIEASPPSKYGSTLTAEQRARAAMDAAADQRPELRAKVDAASRDGSLVVLHEQFKRQERAREFNAHRDPNAGVPVQRDKDLGEHTSTNPPFATARCDQAPHPRGTKRTYNVEAWNAQVREDAERKMSTRRGTHRHADNRPTPYDTLSSGAPYPEPPECGVTVPFNTRHLGKARPDAARTHEATPDLDTLSIRRAHAKATQSASKGMPDFIFGASPPPASRGSSLKDAHDMRCAAANERPISRGKAVNAAAYKATSLW